MWEKEIFWWIFGLLRCRFLYLYVGYLFQFITYYFNFLVELLYQFWIFIAQLCWLELFQLGMYKEVINRLVPMAALQLAVQPNQVF